MILDLTNGCCWKGVWNLLKKQVSLLFLFYLEMLPFFCFVAQSQLLSSCMHIRQHRNIRTNLVQHPLCLWKAHKQNIKATSLSGTHFPATGSGICSHPALKPLMALCFMDLSNLSLKPAKPSGSRHISAMNSIC